MQIRRIFNEIFSIGGYGGGNLPSVARAKGVEAKGISAKELEESLELLYAYIEAELDGEDAAGEFPQVYAAIQASDEAKIQYEDLKEILVSEREGTLIIPERVPNFDFSYLKQPAYEQTTLGSTSSMWRWDRKMGQLFVEFSDELVDSLRQAFATPKLGPAHLRSNSASDELFRLTINPQEEDLSTKFVARSIDAHDLLCDIMVTVERPSLGGAPLMADTRVDLVLPTQTADSTNPYSLTGQAKERIVQYTNPFGEAIFRQIAILDLPHLQFSIEPAPLR